MKLSWLYELCYVEEQKSEDCLCIVGDIVGARRKCEQMFWYDKVFPRKDMV